MNRFLEIKKPTELDLLVALFDLTAFSQYSRSHTNYETFDLLSSYFELVGDIIEAANGHVVKFMGDAGLIAFFEEDIDQGVEALLKLRESGDSWLESRNAICRNTIGAHFGPVVCGQVGVKGSKYFDIFGDTVNQAATLNRRGFAITPQVFRKLNSQTRKHFKKHTPPIIYIPTGAKHPS